MSRRKKRSPPSKALAVVPAEVYSLKTGLQLPPELPPDDRRLALARPRSRIARKLIASWLARYSARTSRIAYLAALKRCSRIPLKAEPEDVLWWELSPAEVSAIRLYLVAAFKPSTAGQAISALRGIIRTAWREGMVDRDRLERLLDQPRVTGTSAPVGRSLSPVELEQLLASVSSPTARREPRAARAGVVLALIYGAGLRRDEVASLDLASIRNGDEVAVIGKGSKYRAVPLPPVSQELIAAWLALRGSQPGPLVCALTRHGDAAIPSKRIGPVAVWRIVQMLCKAGGIVPTPPHDFRRTYASQMLGSGADLTLVQHLMGHSDPRTTYRYDKRPAAVRAAAVRKLPVFGDSPDRAMKRDGVEDGE